MKIEKGRYENNILKIYSTLLVLIAHPLNLFDVGMDESPVSEG